MAPAIKRISHSNFEKHMKLRVIFFAVALCVPAAFSAEDGKKWISQPPDSVSKAKKDTIPPTDVFEVVASRVGSISRDLAKETCVEISENRAKWFTGEYYTCPKGKKPFLVRAVYGFGGTGGYHLFKIGSFLWVSHESLGEEFVSNRSALVVNLEFSPTLTYTTVSIIR